MRICFVAVALAAIASMPCAWAEDIDPDACFCLLHPSGQSQRGCRAEKFPGQFYQTAICRDPETEESAEILMTPTWTVVMEGDEGCEACRLADSATEDAQRGDGGAARVVASRLFAGPNQYPPKKFAAYGILVFRSRASSHDRVRHLMMCEAYVTSLPHASELDVDVSDQMATVWPVDSDSTSDKLNRMPREGMCEIAVDRYGLATALQALKDAELTGMETSGIGPFLLAWSPSADKGKRDALVLVADLSAVSTYRQAQEFLLRWSRDIEQDPSLWRKGWDLDRIRQKIRLWVDDYGPRILALFGAKE